MSNELGNKLNDENTALISFKVSPKIKHSYFKACKKLDCNASQDLRKHVVKVIENFEAKESINER